MNDNRKIGFDRGDGPSSRPRRLVVAMVLAALAAPVAGCSFGGSASGEGTVDIARAKEAAGSGQVQLKGAALRERGGVGKVQKTGRR